MGEAELDTVNNRLIIHSVFYTYGDASTPMLAEAIAEDISNHWNAAHAVINLKGAPFAVYFNLLGIHEPSLTPETVWYNTNPRFNFFRVEEFSQLDISFVDGLGSNTGYFKHGNLLNNSTTAAHEYGHTLGLDHPKELDIRGKGQPGIMYPRGTICDPEFQYDPNALPLKPGGTMNPFTRKVLPADIRLLHLERLSFNRSGFAILGEFSSMYHEKHLPPIK